MESPEPNAQPLDTAPRTLGQPAQGSAHNFFIGPNGIRAGWRLLIFVVILAILGSLGFGAVSIFPVGRAFLASQRKLTVLTPKFEMVNEGILVVCVLVAAWIMSRIERRPFAAYGIPTSQAFRKRFWQGAAWGLAYESLVICGIALFGGFTFGGLALAGTQLLKYAVLWAIGFTLVGIFEEFLFRGYSQFTLGSGIGFWPSAILLSLLFGGVHLSNPNEAWVGALSVFVFGMFACFTLRRTGTLWFAIGLHAAADYAETFLYSVPDSGLLARGHLLNSNLHGPRWLSGGAIGPEGSVISFVMFAVYFVVFNFAFPARPNPQASNPTTSASQV